MNLLERDAIRAVALEASRGHTTPEEVRAAVTDVIFKMSPDVDACLHAIDNAMALYGMVTAVVKSGLR